jgi:hypothetical protein
MAGRTSLRSPPSESIASRAGKSERSIRMTLSRRSSRRQSKDACRAALISSVSSTFRWPGRISGRRSDLKRRRRRKERSALLICLPTRGVAKIQVGVIRATYAFLRPLRRGHSRGCGALRQHNRLLCQLSASRNQAPFVLPSNVTPQPAIAIEVSQFANDIQISVTSWVSYGLEPPGRVVSPTVSVKRILRSAKYSSEAAFFSSSAISAIVCDASSVFLVSPDKPLLPIPFRTGASTSLCLGKQLQRRSDDN